MATVLPYRLRHKMPAHLIAALCFVISLVMFSGHAHAVCSGPSGVEGEVIYNSAHNVPQYCDDTNWIAMTGGELLADSGPTSGLMGYWKFDETSGTFIDSSGNGNDGTAVGTVDYAQTGIIDNAAGFVGGGAEYVNVPYDSSLTPTEDMTIAFWVRPDQDWDSIGGTVWRLIDTHSGAAGEDPGWHVIANGYLGGKMFFIAGDGSVDDEAWGSSFSDWDVGTWYHIAVVFEQNGTTPSVTFYRNGAFTNTSTGTAFTPDWGTDDLRIGAGYYNDSLDGLMDDVRYYNRALSASEIAELYNLSIPTKIAPSGLIAHWRLDETSGTTAADSSGNDNDGSVVSGTITSGPAVINNGISDVNFRKINPNGLSTTEVTVSSWVKVTTDFNYNDVISFNWGSGTGGYALYSNASGNIDFGVMDGGAQRMATDFNAVKIGEWMHWVGTYDGTDIKLYLNGVLVDTESGYPGITLQTSGDFWFVDLGEYMMVDDIRVYNRAISAEEVRELYFARDGIRYNQDERAPQFFDGNKWVSMEPTWFEVSNGLIGHWKLDEMSGTTAVDSSGNGHDGTMQGSMTATDDSRPGAVGTSFDFDGVDDYIDVGESTDFEVSLPVTVAGWVKLDSFDQDTVIFRANNEGGRYNGYWLFIQNSTQKAEISFGDGGGTDSTSRRTKESSTTLATDRWYHIVGVIRGATDMDIYINGVNDGGSYSGSGGALFYDTTAGLTHVIGLDDDGGSPELHQGTLDDIRVYNRELTPSEVQHLYQMGVPVGSSTALPQGCPNIGDVCDDGTIYAGLSPDGNVAMFAAAENVSSGSSWNAGNSDTGSMVTVSSAVCYLGGESGCQTGELNTSDAVILDSDSSTGGFQIHNAAQACYDLVTGGADDWYLPAQEELEIIYNNRNIGAFAGSFDAVQYWTSSEPNLSSIYFYGFDGSGVNNSTKDNTYAVRCVRKGPAPRCANPYGKEGAMTYNNDANVLQYCDGARWVAIGKME